MLRISETLTFGLMLFLGYIINILMNKIHIPGLIGMMILGIFIGPEFLNLISEGVLNISHELRAMALIIILAQTGLHLNLDNLKKVGRPVILLIFLPTIFEIVGAMISSHLFLKFTYPEGLVLGAVLGSVSPALIAAKMIQLIEKRIGENRCIPHLILAASGCEDIFTIILFYAFLNIIGSSKFDWKIIVLGLPISILSGAGLGLLIGFLTVLFFQKTNFGLPSNLLVIVSVGLLLHGLETIIDEAKRDKSWEFVAFSGLLAIIVNGIYILYKLPEKAKELCHGFGAIWNFFEIILFTLVGATLKFDSDFKKDLGFGIVVLLIGLVFRSVGTWISMIRTGLHWKEKVYIIVTFISKATVQATIGGVAFARGYACGKTIMTISIISIILTGPFGSVWMSCMAPILLEKPLDIEDKEEKEDNKDQQTTKQNQHLAQDKKNEKIEDITSVVVEVQKDSEREKITISKIKNEDNTKNSNNTKYLPSVQEEGRGGKNINEIEFFHPIIN